MNLNDSPDDDNGLAEALHERHEHVEHHEHEHEHHNKPYHLEIDRVSHQWPDDYITGEQLLALAGRTLEYEAMRVGPGHEPDQPIPNGHRFYLGNEHEHRFRTRLLR
jgi:hypothetical protein